jgi:hypothetical protein
VADVTTAGPGLASRERVRADRTEGSVYRTFPARSATVLSSIAGVLGVLGSLGTALRASAVETARDEPVQVAVLMGSDSAIGWILAGLAFLAGLSAIAWLTRPSVLKIAAAVATFAFIALSVARLAALDVRAADWARAAQQQPDFVGYHAGFGWGAWLLAAAALFALFSLLVAGLRALDLRKGIAG